MKLRTLNFLFTIIITISLVSAFSTNSSAYNSDVITSSGGRNTGSSSYSTDIILGTITGYTASSSYNTSLGFFYGAGGIAGAVTVNNPPNNPLVSINSTDGSNYENQNLNCFATITDNDSNQLDVTVKWYKDNILNLTADYNNSYSNGTFFNSILDSGNTSAGDNWKCGMRLYDGSAYSDWVNSSSVTILAVPSVTLATSGGGGGVVSEKVITPAPKISVEPQELNINLIVNTSKKEIITVTNIDTRNLTLNISQKNLDNMVFFEETSFEFSSGESKTLNVVFVAPEKPGIYTGRIIIGDKEILVSLNIKSKLLLFDSNIVVLNKDYMVEQGEKLKTKVTIIPMGDRDRLDVTLNYIIKDYDGNVYLTKKETLLVEEQISFDKEFDTGMLPVGNYIIGLELEYPNGIAPSSAHFKVIGKTSFFIFKTKFFFILNILLIILILIILLLIIREMRKRRKQLRHLQIIKHNMRRKKFYSKVNHKKRRVKNT